VERDHDEWRRPWTDGESTVGTSTFAPPEAADADIDADTGASAGAVPDEATTAVAVRPYPQPPPETWDADDEGPGSPAGSVRPPDTTGTVVAPERPRRRGFALGVILAVVGAMIGSLATLGVVAQTDWFVREVAPTTSGGDVTAPVIEVEGDGVNGVVPTVARAVTPSVVRIDILDGSGNEIGLGSGVVYTSDGYILTNNHVVEQASTLRVKLSSGESLGADLVGTDPLNDLAVVKVDRTGLPAINLRTDEEPVVGEMAIAIGSPFGLDASVTAGVVSAVGRDITVPGPNGQARQVIPAVIQTDAAINPGNSGGALVDAEGRLIGINTAILSATGGSQGVGFAISVNQAVLTADQLIETGVVRHAFLGVSGVDVTPEIAERVGDPELQGAVLTLIEPGSAAEAAGFEIDDIVVAIDDEPITSMFELAVAVRQYQPGDTVAVTILRDGQEQQIDVTLGERDLEQ
jgi:S1-C subfamily serine protease